MSQHKEVTISLGMLEIWETLINQLDKRTDFEENVDAVDIFFDDQNECLIAREAIDDRIPKTYAKVSVFNQLLDND